MAVLGRDPESKHFLNGGSVTTSALLHRSIGKIRPLVSVKRLQSGTESTLTGRLADVASKYLKKGSKAYIEGSLCTRKWKDQNGVDRDVTEIRSDVLQLL